MRWPARRRAHEGDECRRRSAPVAMQPNARRQGCPRKRRCGQLRYFIKAVLRPPTKRANSVLALHPDDPRADAGRVARLLLPAVGLSNTHMSLAGGSKAWALDPFASACCSKCPRAGTAGSRDDRVFSHRKEFHRVCSLPRRAGPVAEFSRSFHRRRELQLHREAHVCSFSAPAFDGFLLDDPRSEDGDDTEWMPSRPKHMPLAYMRARSHGRIFESAK